jgi:hypothetical protein
MPVQKFRTFEEARRALWMPPGDPLILERMKRLGELGRPRPVRRGVFRYRSIEEAKAEKHANDRATKRTHAAGHATR